MLGRNDRSLPVALAAIGKVGSHTILNQVLPYLQRPEKDVRIAAIKAVAQLAGDQKAAAVRPHIQQAAQGAEDTVIRTATKALEKIDGTLSLSGGFTGAESLVDDRLASIPPPVPMPGVGAGRTTQQTGVAPPPPPPAASSTARTLLVEGPEGLAQPPPPPETPSFDLDALRPGDVIDGRYKFIQKIGKGAFGTVVLVEDIVVEDRLILKFLNSNVSSDEEMLKRFVHELRYSRRITHKNVIRIYDFLHIGGVYAISMEYFPSHTLGTEIANEKPMRPKKAAQYALDICTGMSVAHQQGIIHRDLKPANILINDDGLVKIVDFGVAAAAKSGDTQLTKTGYVIGSPKYMAPEQILGKKVDERADIYSLGIMAYEMLSGTPPYSRGDHMSVMYQHVQGKAQPLHEANPSLPRDLVDVITKAMSVDKLKRYASMDEFRHALEDVVPNLE